ncbi:GATA transcription factor 16-like protein [Carex littledalei]|uniref:GATA transcription factor 16-like protein n=1 Tax=Carex littledalei TaxID=544730 RepID=A0A833VS44_9POAL|nr:GATA transcription factor 16-like protein [Carex littledalei]
MAPTTNFAIAHEYAKVRSPRRISSNGWSRSEIVLKKTEDESSEERDEVEFLMKKSSSGMQRPGVCANCRTSKTPLWRSGPTGPKSLCNACGIRFRKRQLEAGGGTNPLPFFTLTGEETSSESPSTNVLTLEEMKELQKAKQRRILRFIAKRRFQEMRRRLLERSSRDIMQAAQLLVSLSKGAA